MTRSRTGRNQSKHLVLIARSRGRRKHMRITPNQLSIFGQRVWEEWDCSQQPLPERIKVLLCLIDGAERRLHLQAKLNRLSPDPKETRPHQSSFIVGSQEG